ncbi:cell wall metabolism sensor histidine kinase WalK [Omnitrophica bacterium]|nr:cell wall metabolism sensor histidine kinase WalK [Candidatus Omnitrophota bacterium]
MNTLTVIFAVTIAASVIIATILIIFSQLTSQPKPEAEKEAEKRRSGLWSIVEEEDLRQVIFKEVNEVVGSKRVCHEVSERVSLVFAKELEERIGVNNRRMDKRYKSIIDERNRSEDVAWQKYKKVLAEHRETETVMRSIAEGLVVVDADGNVVMMNPAAEKLLGVSKKDKMGRPILEDLKKAQLVSMIKASSAGSDKEIEMVSQEDETKKILRSSNALIEDKNGQMVGMVSVLSDVTKQKELDRLKESFVSNVTHELRTPLITTQKAISMLRSRDKVRIPPETEKEFFLMAENNMNRLSVLINDMLDLSKLEEGKMELKRVGVSVERVIDGSIESLETWAKAKSITIDKMVQDQMPEVSIDPDRIGQVLINLVGNAIKFTPDNGKVSIEASFERGDGELTVIVEDNGIGIEKENLSKVFDRFHQAAERSPTNIEGTGIGLSIAKEIIALHGGRIWAESEKDQGARFIFKLKSV